MMRDRKADAISTRVAVKAVCAYDGRSNPAARDHLVRTGGAGSVEGLPATEVDSTGMGPVGRRKEVFNSRKRW